MFNATKTKVSKLHRAPSLVVIMERHTIPIFYNAYAGARRNWVLAKLLVMDSFSSEGVGLNPIQFSLYILPI